MSVATFLTNLEAGLSKDAKWILSEGALIAQALSSPLAGAFLALAKDVLPASDSAALTVAMTSVGSITNQLVNWATTLTGQLGSDVGTINTKMIALITDLWPEVSKSLPNAALADVVNLAQQILGLVNPAASVSAGPSPAAAP